jgi:hypothetical protein
MTTTEAITKISLNLSEKYVPQWREWEIAREIIANAKDADPSYLQDTPDSDTLVVTTSSVPTLEQLMVIGETTKSMNGSTIGQFGEGFKLAALACLRLKGTISVRVPFGTITFQLERPPSFTSRLLHALIHHSHQPLLGACETTIRLPGIVNSCSNRFTPLPPGPLPKLPDHPNLRVFSKGIWIQTIPFPSLYDWNLTNVTINRDRSVIDTWTLRQAIGAYLIPRMTVDTALAILKDETLFEAEVTRSAQDRFATPQTKSAFEEALIQCYGAKVCIADPESNTNNERAISKGYNPVPVPLPFHPLFRRTIRRAEDFKPKPRKQPRKPVNSEPHRSALREIYALLELLNCPSHISIFSPSATDQEDGIIGTARICKGSLLIELSEELFKPGRRLDRLHTVLHEIAHLAGDFHDDGTLAYEHDLGKIAARCAMAWMDQIPVAVTFPPPTTTPPDPSTE